MNTADEEKNIIRNNGYELNFISDRLSNDQAFMLELVSKDPLWMSLASNALKSNKAFVLRAVKKDPRALARAGDELRADRDFILEAVRWDGEAFEYASSELRVDREIVLEAVKSRVQALEYASEDLRSDREVVLEAVKSNCVALIFASEDLRSDREVVLEAVKSNGVALIFASGYLQKETTLFDKVCESKGGDEDIQKWKAPEWFNYDCKNGGLKVFRPFLHQRVCHLRTFFGNSKELENLTSKTEERVCDESWLVLEHLTLKDYLRSKQVCKGGLQVGLRGFFYNKYSPFLHQRMCHLRTFFGNSKNSIEFKNLTSKTEEHVCDESSLVADQLSLKDYLRSKQVCKGGLQVGLMNRFF